MDAISPSDSSLRVQTHTNDVSREQVSNTRSRARYNSIGLFALFAYDIDREAQTHNELSKDNPKERKEEIPSEYHSQSF